MHFGLLQVENERRERSSMSLEITHFYSGYRSGSLFILSISHNTPTPTFYNSTVAASLSVSVLTCTIG